MVFLDTPLHFDAVIDESTLPWHKYLKRQQSKNSHPYNPPVSLSPALENMKVVTELIAGLYSFTSGTLRCIPHNSHFCSLSEDGSKRKP
jgi:hypothetical protein